MDRTQRHLSEYIHLCFAEEIKSFWFGTTRGSKWWQNFNFWVNCLFKFNHIVMTLRMSKLTFSNPWTLWIFRRCSFIKAMTFFKQFPHFGLYYHHRLMTEFNYLQLSDNCSFHCTNGLTRKIIGRKDSISNSHSFLTVFGFFTQEYWLLFH